MILPLHSCMFTNENIDILTTRPLFCHCQCPPASYRLQPPHRSSRMIAITIWGPSRANSALKGKTLDFACVEVLNGLGGKEFSFYSSPYPGPVKRDIHWPFGTRVCVGGSMRRYMITLTAGLALAVPELASTATVTLHWRDNAQ